VVTLVRERGEDDLDGSPLVERASRVRGSRLRGAASGEPGDGERKAIPSVAGAGEPLEKRREATSEGHSAQKVAKRPALR
jgi:hypothetical protein